MVNVLSFSYTGLDLLDVANVLKWAFLVLPNYCLGQGLGDMFNNYNALDFFNKAVDMCIQANLPPPYPHTKQGCEKSIRKLGGNVLEFQENYLAWDNPGIGRYLIFLAWEGIVFFALVLLIEYGVFRACRRFLARVLHACTPFSARGYVNVGVVNEESILGDDDDVLLEKARVMTSEDISDVLAIKELTKVFPGKNRKFCFILLFLALIYIGSLVAASKSNRWVLLSSFRLKGERHT